MQKKNRKQVLRREISDLLFYPEFVSLRLILGATKAAAQLYGCSQNWIRTHWEIRVPGVTAAIPSAAVS